MARAIQTFEVSLKAAIFHNGRLMLLREADTGFWELPGGRIDVGEETLAHATILQREINEELGLDFHIAPRPTMVTFVRQRPTDGIYQFIAVQLADYVRGTAKLSGEHSELRWTTPEDWPEMAVPEPSGYRLGLQRIWDLEPIKGRSLWNSDS